MATPRKVGEVWVATSLSYDDGTALVAVTTSLQVAKDMCEEDACNELKWLGNGLSHAFAQAAAGWSYHISKVEVLD